MGEVADEGLAVAARAGDQVALEALYEYHAPGIYGYFALLGGAPQPGAVAPGVAAALSALLADPGARPSGAVRLYGLLVLLTRSFDPPPHLEDQVLALRLGAGLGVAEIAAVLDCGVPTVQRLQYHALRRRASLVPG